MITLLTASASSTSKTEAETKQNAPPTNGFRPVKRVPAATNGSWDPNLYRGKRYTNPRLTCLGQGGRRVGNRSTANTSYGGYKVGIL